MAQDPRGSSHPETVSCSLSVFGTMSPLPLQYKSNSVVSLMASEFPVLQALHPLTIKTNSVKLSFLSFPKLVKIQNHECHLPFPKVVTPV